MILCPECTTPGYCREHAECRRGVPLVERVPVRPPVENPVHIPPPAASTVEVKPPAPSNEPKGAPGAATGSTMSTQQVQETRNRWAMLGAAAVNAVLAALGMSGADVGPVLDALVIGDWGNAIAALVLLLGALFAPSLTRAFNRAKP